MKAHLRTWKAIAEAWAQMWKDLAKQAKPDPALVLRMMRIATALDELVGYLDEKIRDEQGGSHGP